MRHIISAKAYINYFHLHTYSDTPWRAAPPAVRPVRRGVAGSPGAAADETRQRTGGAATLPVLAGAPQVDRLLAGTTGSARRAIDPVAVKLQHKSLRRDRRAARIRVGVRARRGSHYFSAAVTRVLLIESVCLLSVMSLGYYLNFGQVQPLGENPQLQKTRVCN